MQDPVALAYSGRIDEARHAALLATASDDPSLVAQGLEAFAVLGQQHAWTPDPAVVEVVARFALESGRVGRNAWAAATALGIRALGPLACDRLAGGKADWVVLRYAGEWPSEALGVALERALPSLGEGRDEALLALAVQPVADREVLERRAVLARAAAADREAGMRLAAATVLPVLVPESCRVLLDALVDDRDESVAAAAKAALVRHADATFSWGRWIAAKQG